MLHVVDQTLLGLGIVFVAVTVVSAPNNVAPVLEATELVCVLNWSISPNWYCCCPNTGAG